MRPYGRIFSWTFIYLVNVALVLVWLASTTPFTFAELGGRIVEDVLSAYAAVVSSMFAACRWIFQKCTRT